MHFVFYDPGAPKWRNFLGIVSAIVLLPIIILIKLILIPFEKPANIKPSEVSKFLREFHDGTGGAWDYDDFVSVPIADPRLDKIRKRVSDLELPITDEGKSELRKLLAEVERMDFNDVTQKGTPL